jgi:hypothetical protein
MSPNSEERAVRAEDLLKNDTIQRVDVAKETYTKQR